MYRRSAEIEVFLVHPGGPFWANKDSWTIPKGEYENDEDPFAAAQREFREETGCEPHPPFLDLGEIRQASGKIVKAWAFEGDCDPADLQSNTCTIEWPPRSRRQIEIPEVDRGAWFSIEAALPKIFKGQDLLLRRLAKALS
jgi:predicted NUDIX family NTP pyrophosphohydrolase